MRKSDFYYDFLTRDNQPILVIHDLDLGRISVTNNIENVLFEIEGKIQKNLDNHPIIYRDTRGIYDEVIKNNGEITFRSIGETDLKNAMSKLLDRANR